MYADDLIIISTTKEGLQNSLNSLQSYCEQWKLDINHKKSKVMVFTKGTQKEKNRYTINNKALEVVREYKYLGISISSKNCSFTPTLTDLHCKGTRAMYALFSLLPMKLLSVKTLLKIFDACIAPIIMYGCEVWAPYLNHEYSKWNTNIIERLHMQFLKRILGVNRSTTNDLVRAELGRVPLVSLALSRNINYIRNIKLKNNSILVKQAYNYECSVDKNRPNILSLTKTYEDNFKIFLNEDPLTITRNKLRTTIFCLFNWIWQNEIQKFTKAEKYVQFKTNLKYEKYLSTIKNRKHRVAYTKYRLSDHKLSIEQGRRKNPKIPRDLRICPLCQTEVENETHFLLKCKAYTDRNDFFDWIATNHVPNFKNLNDENKYVYLMSQENDLVTSELARKIATWFNRREKLITN